MKMKIKNKLGLTILAIAILIIPIGVTAFQQQHAYAPRECPGCLISEFKQVTHEFEKNVIGDPNLSQGPAPHLRELLDAYALDVMRIFLGGPDTIPVLLAAYQQDVLAVFVSPPEPDKQQLHDQIKEFRQLTHGFVQQVIQQIQQQQQGE